MLAISTSSVTSGTIPKSARPLWKKTDYGLCKYGRRWGILASFFVGTTYCWGMMQDALVQEKLALASTLASVGLLAVTSNAVFAILHGRLLPPGGGMWLTWAASC